MSAAEKLEEMKWPEVIEAAREKFIEIAPTGMEFTAERAYAVQLLQNNDYLKQAAINHPASLQAAVLNVAGVGLSLNPAKKQAYLIPRSVKHKVDGRDQYILKVFLEPSYMGLCDLATMSGSIKWVQANLVFANDKFADNGPGNAPTHTYDPFAIFKDRGEFKGAYCVAKTADGDYLTTIMSAEEINGIRDRSEAYKKGFGPWKTDENEQRKKTVVRRAFKMWPKTETLDRMALAVRLSNENEGFEPIINAPQLEQYTPEMKEHYDHMISKSDGIGMFLFSTSIPESARVGLYHSFPKGEKGKYQGIVRSLQDSGRNKLEDLKVGIMDAAQQGYDGQIAELIEGLSDEALEWISDNVDAETAGAIRSVQQAA